VNYLDYILVVLLVIAAIKGLVKGFIYEVVSLIALIAGVWGAIQFSGETKRILIDHFSLTNSYIDIIAFVITFIVIIILVHFIGKAVEKAIKAIAMGFVNRLLGLVFSVLKTAFILGVVLVVIERVDEGNKIVPQKDIEASVFYSPLRNVAISTFPFLKGLYDELIDENENKKKRRGKRASGTIT
jgi:membrane protein required for colicin V production